MKITDGYWVVSIDGKHSIGRLENRIFYEADGKAGRTIQSIVDIHPRFLWLLKIDPAQLAATLVTPTTT